MKQILKLLLLLPAIVLFFCSHTVKYSTELIPIMRGLYIEYIDHTGHTVIKGNYLKGSMFREGLALVQADNELMTWGYIDTNGNYVIPTQYITATVFSEGVAWVTKRNSRPIAIDQTGQELFTLDNAEVVGNYTEGLAKFAIYDEEGVLRWGFVDKKGNVVVQPIYKEVKSFSEGVAPVKLPSQSWGYIDKTGAFVIAPQYYSAKIFRNGLAVVYKNIDEATIVDKENKVVLTESHNDLHVDGNLIMFEKDYKFGWLNREGKVVIPAIYEEIHPFSTRDLALVRMNNLFGYINKKGEMVIEPQYADAYMFLGDIAPVTNDGYTGFIGKKGNYVIAPTMINIPFDIATQTYLLDTHYRMVFSEFINTGEILKKIDISHLEGITPQMSYEGIFKLFKKEASDYKDSSIQTLVNKKAVTIDISYSFSTIGDPLMLQGNPSDSPTKPTSFRYDFYLSANMNKRIDKLEEKLITALGDFTNSSANTYENAIMELTVKKDFGLLSFELEFK